MSGRFVTLRDHRDKLGRRYLGATLTADGTLRIEGQDLGVGVEQVFGPGNREYEWAWTIRPSNVAKLGEALNAGKNVGVLAALEQRFSGEAAAGLQTFLDEHDVPYESWSRIGD